jgi:hypothetical protein
MNLNEENLEEYFTRIINPIELIAWKKEVII